MSRLRKLHDCRNRRRQSLPIRRFLLELPSSKPGQRVELRATVVLTGLPFGLDPSRLLQLVECRIERAIAHLEDVARHLLQALTDRPAVERLEREDLEEQKIECSLNQIRWAAHFTSLTERRA